MLQHHVVKTVYARMTGNSASRYRFDVRGQFLESQAGVHADSLRSKVIASEIHSIGGGIGRSLGMFLHDSV